MKNGILCLFSSPLIFDNKPISVLNFEIEERIIREKFEESDLNYYKVRFATVDEFFNSKDDDFSIIHFSGHGIENSLLFENENGEAYEFIKEDLKEIFSTINNLELVVLSACFSESVGEELINSGLKRVLAIKKDNSIHDKFATEFIKVFYKGILIDKTTIEKAYSNAKLYIKYSQSWKRHKDEIIKKGERTCINEDQKFVLLPRNQKVDSDTIISGEKNKKIINKYGCTKTNLPKAKRDLFLGRELDMLRIIELVKTNKLVTIKGAGGIGKTAIAIEVSKWFHNRDRFKGGVFFIDLRGIRSVEEVYNQFGEALESSIKDERDLINNLEFEDNILFILDNAEDILQHERKNFRKFLNVLLMNTLNNYLVTSQTEVGGILYNKEFVEQIDELPKYIAEGILISRIKNIDRIERFNLDRLINIIGGNPLPLLITSTNINKGYDIDKIIERIEEERDIKEFGALEEDRNSSFKVSLKIAYESMPKSAREMFELLSLFPKGATKEIFEKVVFKENFIDSIIYMKEYSLINFEKDMSRISLQPSIRIIASGFLREDTVKENKENLLDYCCILLDDIKTNYYKLNSLKYKILFNYEEQNIIKILTFLSKHVTNNICSCKSSKIVTELLTIYLYEERISEGIRNGEFLINICIEKNNYEDKAKILKLISDLYVMKDAFYIAEEKYLECLEIYSEYENFDKMIEVIESISNLYIKMDLHDKARNQLKKGLNICLEWEDKNGEARILKLLADIFKKICDFDKAEELYRESLNIYINQNSKLNEATILDLLAELYKIRSDYINSKRLYEKSKNIRVKEFGEYNSLVANSYINISKLNRVLGEYKKAIDICMRAIEIQKNVLGNNNRELSISFEHIADLYKDQCDYIEAERYYINAFKIKNDLFGRINTNTASCNVKLAKLYEKIGKYEEAEEIFKKTLKIKQEILGDNHQEVSKSYVCIADFYKNIGIYKEAEEMYKKAIEISLKNLGEKHEDTANSYNS
ncbi:MAG: tetratricopeptide repeat protein, partial [Clostridiales bacterium]